MLIVDSSHPQSRAATLTLMSHTSHHIQMSTMEMMHTCKEILHSFLLFMLANQVFTPYDSFEEACHQLNVDVTLLLALYATCYLNGRDHSVPKCGQLHLAWEYGLG